MSNCDRKKYKNFCIKSICIQSADDVVIWDNGLNLVYVDLSSSSRKRVPVIFQGSNAIFNKASALTNYRDDSEYHVIYSLVYKYIFIRN